MNKLNEVRKLVESRFKERDWKYHIVPVIKYAKKLAQKYNVNKETLELAVLLHDIGRVDIKHDEDHHVVGIPIAEKILKRFNYSDKVIKEIKHVVESHRTSKGPRPETLIAKIVANADAMAHFDILPIFFHWRHGRHSFEENAKWVEEKIKKDWQKKLTLPGAKKIVEKKYKAILLILDSLKEYSKKN
jgi:putative nucleotidyltransferase with HDIG domain